jgi:hypothetical protein
VTPLASIAGIPYVLYYERKDVASRHSNIPASFLSVLRKQRLSNRSERGYFFEVSV